MYLAYFLEFASQIFFFFSPWSVLLDSIPLNKWDDIGRDWGSGLHFKKAEYKGKVNCYP